MHSLQVKYCIPESDRELYSELQVMRSAAGFYIGTIHTSKDGFEEPGSRDTTYFQSQYQADLVLQKMEEFWDDNEELFVEMFEEWLYETGWDENCVGYRLTP